MHTHIHRLERTLGPFTVFPDCPAVREREGVRAVLDPRRARLFRVLYEPLKSPLLLEPETGSGRTCMRAADPSTARTPHHNSAELLIS